MISIIIPTFNEESTIEETVKQFEALTLPHEVIVSDTKSTDRTLAVAAQCADVALELKSREKAGVSIGRNHGGRAAKGEFIVFLDASDTIPNPDAFFRRALKEFERHSKLVGISGRIEVEPHLRTVSDWLIFGAMNVWFFFLNNIIGFGIAAGKFQMIRAEAFRKSGGFNERLPAGEDVDFFRRLQETGPTRIVWHLVVYHSGRRFHQLGAWKTLYRWIKNAFSVWFLKKSADEGWVPVR